MLDALHIYTTPASHADLVFIARELVLCTLPHSDPGNVPVWGRTNGKLTLKIQPGYKKDDKTGKYICIGYPYGTIPRLILIWMITEILRTKSRRLELGHHLSDFLAKIGLSLATGGGVRGDAKRVRQQMERLFRSIISFEYSQSDSGRTGSAWVDMQVAPDGFFWWDEKSPDQAVLWGSWIEVGEKFYQAVLANPYPLDIRVLRHIKNSALGIDLYTILNREAYRARKDGKPRFLAWEWLYVQTGNEYTTEHALDNFRRKALEQIAQILEVHSGLLVTLQKGHRGQKSGLVISNHSTPSIAPTPQAPSELPGSEAAARLASLPPKFALVPPMPQPTTRQLRPATVETFRECYPVLDPYECQRAFDYWQAGLPEDKRAKHYDRAFLGFARKWVFGKA
ncbi:hypothetical protein MishRS11D_46480 (plasmid) [Methylomagnum ishizawai]|nr:hypothetical protein MishRS11D_46480 [Methylomagnum ishizawai]